MDDRARREGVDMGGEDTAQGVAVVIGDALAEDFAAGRIQEGEQIGGAVALVVEVFTNRRMAVSR